MRDVLGVVVVSLLTPHTIISGNFYFLVFFTDNVTTPAVATSRATAVAARGVDNLSLLPMFPKISVTSGSLERQ